MSKSGVPINSLVIRGPTWQWSDSQDNNGSLLGRVVKYSSERWLTVEWDNDDNRANYRYSDGCLDVIVIGYSTNNEEVLPLYYRNTTLIALNKGLQEFLVYLIELNPNKMSTVDNLLEFFFRFFERGTRYHRFLTDELITRLQKLYEYRYSDSFDDLIKKLSLTLGSSEEGILAMDLPEILKTDKVHVLTRTIIINKYYQVLEKIIDHPSFIRSIAEQPTLHHIIVTDNTFPRKMLYKLRDYLVLTGAYNLIGAQRHVDLKKVKALQQKYDPKFCPPTDKLPVCQFCQDDIQPDEKKVYQPANCSCFYHLECAIDLGRSILSLATKDRSYLKPNCLGCGNEYEMGFLYLISTYAQQQRRIYGDRILKVSPSVADKRIKLINQAYREQLEEKDYMSACKHCHEFMVVPPDQEEWIVCSYCYQKGLFIGNVKKQQDELKKPEILALIKERPDNFKPCPRCFKLLEKNGGCHHFICGFCSYSFDWNKQDDKVLEKVHY